MSKRITKAILTGGGRATRLHPITTTINKHLLPLANKPMIFHAIEKVVEAGVTDVFINVNPGETSLQEVIGDGGHWGIRITFFEQTGGPQGIAHVVNEAKKFIGNDPFIFYLSDNIIVGSITHLVDAFYESNHDCMLALSKVPDPERFGVPVFDADGTLIDVLEKPENPPCDFAVTGIYVYGAGVFFDAFEKIEKSHRGEYEISSIHSHFLQQGLSVGYKEITGWWKDTGKPYDLLLANELLLEGLHSEHYLQNGQVHEDAVLEGNVRIGAGSVIAEGVLLRGPVIVGENCVLKNCTIGPHATISAGCEISDATIKNSIILENTVIAAPVTIQNSLIGKSVQIRKKESSDNGQLLLGDKTVLYL